jgi:uncharacterized protein YjbJ (UPF0337 family)
MTMNKDQVDGRRKQVTGKIKEVTGKIVGDKEMEAQGNAKHKVGKLQAGVGDVRSDLKKMVS